MANVILSPCLYLKNNELTNLGELIEVLEFVNDFLTCDYILSDSSILYENNWYSLPKYKPIIYNQFTTLVVPLLRKVMENEGTNIIHVIDENISYSISDSQYIITDKDEFNSMLNCIYQGNTEYLFFVGSINKNVSDLLYFLIEKEKISIPVVNSVWLDKSGHFDNFIKEDVKDYNNVFPCKELCQKIGNTILEIGNKSLFKEYAKIIAERNGYHKLPYSSRQYKNVPYYMRNDYEYIICVDTLHGLFEVFQKTGSTYENYRGEYDFSCNEVTGKTSSSETHICYITY